MTTLSAQTDDIALDPFDHDGFIVSVKRNLFEAQAVALHPDGEFICRAVRQHRSLAKLGYWLAALALIALGLVGMIVVLTRAPASFQSLATVGSILYLIVGVALAVRFAPYSAVVVLLDNTDRADASPELVLKRGARLSVAGDVSTMHAAVEGEFGRLRRYGANSSNYSLIAEGGRVIARFVPARKAGTGTLIASALGPFGVLGTLFVVGQPADSWTIVRPTEGIRIGSLVKQKSALGDYVLDLTDDLDRAIDRRAITLAALTVVHNRASAR